MQEDIIQTICKDSNYHLALFTADEIEGLRTQIVTKTSRGRTTPFIRCIVRNREIQLRPEEVVRQLYAARLINQYGYPKRRLNFEHPVNFGREKKKADIVIFDKDRVDSAYIIVELKSPSSTMAKASSAPTATPPARPSAYGRTANRSPITTAKTPTTLKTSPLSRT